MIPRLRDMLAELGIIVVPGFVTIPMAMKAFNEDGTIKEEQIKDGLKTVIERLINECNR